MKLDDTDVAWVRHWADRGHVQRDIARAFRVSSALVCFVLSGKRRTALRPTVVETADKRRASARAYRERWPDRVAAKPQPKTDFKRRYAYHKEQMVLDPVYHTKFQQRQAAWRAKNQGKIRACYAVANSRRRTAIANTLFVSSDWREILSTFNRACAYCLRNDVKLELEHVIPLSAGGLHEYANIVPACRSCNGRKYNRGPLMMVGALK